MSTLVSVLVAFGLAGPPPIFIAPDFASSTAVVECVSGFQGSAAQLRNIGICVRCACAPPSRVARDRSPV